MVDWWLTDSEGIVAFWLLIFALCNGLRGVYCRFRDRDARRKVEALISGGIHPVRASYLLGGMADAAETAVCMLVDEGVVRVSSNGELRPTRRGRTPKDPALRAMAEGIGEAPAKSPTKLYEIQDEARFGRFRKLVERAAPQVRTTTSGKSQTLMLATTMVTSIGMGIHAARTEAPAPFIAGADRSVWLYVCMVAWVVQWGPACLWPSENRRRWRALDRYCKNKADNARAAVPRSTRQAIARSKERPAPPPAPPQPRPRTHSRTSDGGVPGIVDVDSCSTSSSCGGCGGCGGD